jgi:dephospho-CoA kinase
MLQIALTGGIAAGKSTVSARLAEHGAIVVDSDVLAREVVAPGTDGLAAIEAAFGSSVISDDGSLDRAALGAIVFSDAAARDTLNGITHPRIRARSKQLVAEASADAVIIHDIPLLFETARERLHSFDRILVVEADDATRLNRLVTLRGMAVDEAERRIASQATNADRRSIATDVIDSNGTRDETLRQVDEFWGSLPAH